jgi:type VI secretion system protein ImpK
MQENVNLKYGADKDSSFIVRYFEDFYGEIIRQKSLVLGYHTLNHAREIGVGPEKLYKADLTPSIQAGPENVTPEVQAPAQPQEAAVPEQIIQTLISLLSSQAIDSARFGGEFAAKYFKEAEFIMAALADEIFLQLDWSGKEYWEKNLLEDRLYGTHNAGQLFFDKIDDFLSIRDPSRADLAMLYLLCLGLGFKGKYRDQDDGGRLEHYRRELFIFIYHRDPTLYELGTRLFPEIYQYTIEDNKVTYLNDVRPWMYVFSSVGVVLLFASYVVWAATTSSIDQLTKSIIAQSEQR